MTRLSRRFVGPVAALLTIGLAGCGSTAALVTTSTPDLGTIGIAMPTTGSARWIADGDNMVKQFEALGYKVDLRYAEDDPKEQLSQLNEMIAAGDKALVIGAVDGSALTDALDKADAAGVPVIAYDRLLRDSKNVDYYATFDNFKVGVLQAQTIVDKLGLKKSGGKARTIELFAGSADDNNAKFFFDGAMSVLKPYIKSGALVVPSGQTSFAKVTTLRWDGEVAGARMDKMLEGADEDVTLDAVLSPYDGISRGIITSLQNHGYGTKSKKLPVVTGQDAELESVKLIKQGVQAETVYKDTRELAKVAVQMTDKVLSDKTPDINDSTTYDNGVKVVPAFLLQPVNVDKSNLVTVLVDGGYYKESELN
ncbi:multiple monosaccharide ABC transporter substrate-binding protein [Actinoplanes rectilineatus]|uniref:multiple monosaccharide ABC transporter substrate-binding protein n=1 Tax=Actinoplanes rectilineatus TaxID=113571 RepID=UPI00316AC2E4